MNENKGEGWLSWKDFFAERYFYREKNCDFRNKSKSSTICYLRVIDQSGREILIIFTIKYLRAYLRLIFHIGNKFDSMGT